MGSKSPLADVSVDFGSEKSNPRKYSITKFTPHHMAGIMEADDCARSHLYGDREASANYYIGPDGLICAGVAEDRRSWASSSRENDHAAITVEVSNSGAGPDWPISDAAYRALVLLGADICSRYGIRPHFDGSPAGTITMHKMFTSTACPGPYLEALISSGQLEADILAAMDEKPQPEQPESPEKDPVTLYRVQTGAFRNKDNAMRQAEKMQAAGFDNYVVKIGDFYKVQAGAFRDMKNADDLVRRLAVFGFPAIIRTEGGVAEKPGTGKRSPEEIAREVIRGDWGNDPERSRALREAGYDPEIIQAEVNKIFYNEA